MKVQTCSVFESGPKNRVTFALIAQFNPRLYRINFVCSLQVRLQLALLDLGLDAGRDFVDASPLVLVLRTSADYEEAFQNVDDVVNAPSLHTELFRAAVEEQHALALNAVVVEEAAAKFAQRFLFSRVLLRQLGLASLALLFICTRIREQFPVGGGPLLLIPLLGFAHASLGLVVLAAGVGEIAPTLFF